MFQTLPGLGPRYIDASRSLSLPWWSLKRAFQKHNRAYWPHSNTQTNWYRFYGVGVLDQKHGKLEVGKPVKNSHSEKKPKELAQNHPPCSWLRTTFLRPAFFPQFIADSLSHWEHVFFELSVPILLPRSGGNQGLLNPLNWEELLICMCVKIPSPVLLNCWP